ncbi:MAG: MBOAT family protein [Lachnospiraceae bacterium]|nr:MBOAT family protein [Lachnospiraceae bacterium]
MSITGMLFLLCFFPICLGIYHIVRNEAKEYVLLAFSLLFYAFGTPQYLILFVSATFLTVLIGRIINNLHKKSAKTVLLVLGIAMNSSLLLYYKYSDFLLINIGKILPVNKEPLSLLLPLGISFFTFKAISYLADVYKGDAVLSANPLHDALYLSFFGQIQSGPLTRYKNFSFHATGCKALFCNGIIRFMTGFVKKALIADVLNKIVTEVFSKPVGACSASYLWLGAISFSLQLFFDFAGYSDMAIGISEMFGYPCMENFNYPYMTDSVGHFFRRWHISLSEWFRDYIYIPLGGSRNKWKPKVYFNLFVVWVLTGIWHGASWNFVFWGLLYFILISFEKLTGLPDKIKPRIGKVFYRIFSLVFIVLNWVMFRAGSLQNGLSYIKNMFINERNPLSDARALFLIKDYRFFLLCAILFCFPIVPWAKKKLENRKVLFGIVKTVYYITLIFAFIWALSFTFAGYNNPFAYANF